MSERSPNTGWECPRCELVHSPEVLTCSCAPRKQQAQPPTTQESEYIQRLREQNAGALVDQNRRLNEQHKLTDCPRCWQHGFNRTHGLMEVCPYGSRQ